MPAFIGSDGATDEAGMLVEDFGIADNLMIEGGIAASGGGFFAGDIAPASVWQDLIAFERAVAATARLLAQSPAG